MTVYNEGAVLQVRGEINGTLTLAAPLGKPGAAGKAFRVDGHQERVAKIYLEAESPQGSGHMAHYEAKVTAMRDMHFVSSHPDQFNFAWPTSLLYDNGKFVGYVMPTLGGEITPLENLLIEFANSLGTSTEGTPALTDRLQIAAHLAQAVGDLHARGVHIVDLKPLNVLVERNSNRLLILDCDGFNLQAHSASEFRAKQFTPLDGYVAPEVLTAGLKPEDLRDAEDHDCFALGTMIFKLLNRNIHPYLGVAVHDLPEDMNNLRAWVEQNLYPYARDRAYFHNRGIAHLERHPRPYSEHDWLDDELITLFERCFIDPSQPQNRPRPGEWATQLATCLNPPLPLCPVHQRHYYPGRGCLECGDLALEAKRQLQRITSLIA